MRFMRPILHGNCKGGGKGKQKGNFILCLMRTLHFITTEVPADPPLPMGDLNCMYFPHGFSP